MAIKHFRCDYSQYQSEICEGAVCVPLTLGKHGLVDIEDFLQIKEKQLWYAKRVQKVFYMQNRKIAFHGHLMGKVAGMEIDHINGNGLDNRRSNLRLCLPVENKRNVKKTNLNGSSSKYKGVSWSTRLQKWMANIYPNDTSIYLGVYSNEVDAAMAYNAAAIIHYGEYAKLNVIEAAS